MLTSDINSYRFSNSMKILASKIKKWSFKERLKIMRQHLGDIEERTIMKMPEDDQERLAHVLQDLDYWLAHMADPSVDKVKPKKKKPVNLWDLPN